MVSYLPRLIEPVIEQLFAELPAPSIAGRERRGKTTTAARNVVLGAREACGRPTL